MYVNDKILKNSNSDQTISFFTKKNKNKVLKNFNKDIDRSIKSINKQIKFVDKNLFSIPVEKIVSSKKKIIIQMPFVEGISGADIFSYGNINLLKKIKKEITIFIEKNIEESKIEKLDYDFFEKKISLVYSNTSNSHLKELIKKVGLKIKKENFKNLSFLSGFCHGDLTFSNMICNSNNEIILFDFLDTYYESPFQDLSKLRQELDYLWSLRFSNKQLEAKAKIVNQFFYEGSLEKIFKNYKKEINIFSLITLIRIAPYISDRLTKDWLLKSITNQLNRSI